MTRAGCRAANVWVEQHTLPFASPSSPFWRHPLVLQDKQWSLDLVPCESFALPFVIIIFSGSRSFDMDKTPSKKSKGVTAVGELIDWLLPCKLRDCWKLCLSYLTCWLNYTESISADYSLFFYVWIHLPLIACTSTGYHKLNFRRIRPEMRQLYILKCALTQKLRQLLCPSSHTTFHWVPPLSPLSLPPLLSPLPSFFLSVVFVHGICGGAMAKVQSDSHWIICLGIVALFRFPFSFHVLLFFFLPFCIYLLLHES